MSDTKWMVLIAILIFVAITFSFRGRIRQSTMPRDRAVRQCIKWVDIEGRTVYTPTAGLDDSLIRLLIKNYGGTVVMTRRR